MTEDEYWAGIRNIPLHYDREAVDGEGVIYRDRNGQPVFVTKPHLIPEEKRAAAVALYREQYGPQIH